MYLIYLDDGGKGSIKVLGGVVINHREFASIEFHTAAILHDLFGTERVEAEFHASDLFLGLGQFEGLDEAKRHKALRWFVQTCQQFKIPYIYSALDTGALSKSPLRSASWMDTAFFMCACAIDELLQDAHRPEYAIDASGEEMVRFPDRPLSLIVVDEPEQARDKGTIRNHFRDMRQPLARAFERFTPPEQVPGAKSFILTNRLQSPVDDVFFGDSEHSLGLQLADACNWVLWRHLRGEDAGFFQELAKGKIVCAKPEPEWSQYRHLFRSHDDGKVG